MLTRYHAISNNSRKPYGFCTLCLFLEITHNTYSIEYFLFQNLALCSLHISTLPTLHGIFILQHILDPNTMPAITLLPSLCLIHIFYCLVLFVIVCMYVPSI